MTNFRELSGFTGGVLWMASWVATGVISLNEMGGWFGALLLFGVTGPFAGFVVGIVSGNWIAFILGAAAWGLIGIAPDLNLEPARMRVTVGRGRCGFHARILELERRSDLAKHLAHQNRLRYMGP